MYRLLIAIGITMAPAVHAQADIYDKILESVKQEAQTKEADLAIQRFAAGTYYDHELTTIDDADKRATFEIEKEEYVDMALKEQVLEMCGSQKDRKNQYITCLQAQQQLRRLVEKNTWPRALGRDLQAIASGYEAGIEGYPGKVVDVIAKFAGITNIWRATNDPFVTPILEVLTRAEPWPQGKEEDIENKAAEVEGAVKSLEVKKDEKTDRTKFTAAVWRYRHGVRYVQSHEGEDCEDFNAKLDEYLDCVQGGRDEAECNAEFGDERSDPSMIMLQHRWCDVEDKLIELSDIIQEDPIEIGNEEHIIYPSHVNEDANLYIWIRRDDVGLQPYIPLEPVQATLYHPDYDDCIDGGNIHDCYDRFTEYLIRGGKYPSKIGDEERKQQPSINGGGEVHEIPDDQEEEDTRKNNSVVEEPDPGDGICSHPFGKRGYLCRNIEYEACDITQKQQDQLLDAGTGGIVLTSCEPERFNGDVARRISGSNICGIGGWRETVPANVVQDTPKHKKTWLYRRARSAG